MITYLGEQVTLLPLATPAAPDLTRQGSAGSTTYTYVVVARRGLGHTDASSEASLSDGASSLSTLDFIQIAPPYVQGAHIFDIYRTVGETSQGKIGSFVPIYRGTDQVGQFPDYGQAGDGEGPPDTNTTGELFLPGIAEGDFLQVGDDGVIEGIADLTGIIAFTDLIGGIADYTGLGGELVTIKATEDGLETVSVDDLILAGQSADSSHKGFLTAADWSMFDSKQPALGYTPENVANKSTTTALGTSNTLYPTHNAVKTYVDTGLGTKEDTLGYTPENVANKSTTTALGSSNTLYPTQNAVKAYVDAGLALKQDTQGASLELLKQTGSASAPGDGVGLLRWEAGTDSGTLKLVAYSGTDTTGVTIVDNVGSGNT